MPEKFRIPVIALAGLKGSGKSTVAQILERHLPQPVLTIGFADQIKRALLALLEGCLPFDLTCEAARSVWGESKDRERQIGKLVKNDDSPLTYRYALQQLGDIPRRTWHRDIHVTLATNKIRQAKLIKSVVIPDLRYTSEARVVHECGGSVWRLRRGRQSRIRELANCIPWSYRVGDLLGLSPLASEREMHYRTFDRWVDVEIANNGTVQDLEQKVLERLQGLQHGQEKADQVSDQASNRA